MIHNYFQLLFRQFRKNTFLMGVNLVGLTLGLTCAILALMFFVNERMFDQFHKNKDQIVRLYKKNISINDGTEAFTAETSGYMGPTLVEDYPEVLKCVRIMPWFEKTVLSFNNKHQQVENLVFADSTLFEVFSFHLLRGDPATALLASSSIVLNEALATRLFGSEDPIGQTITGLHDLEYVVTGVIENTPPHSHLQYEALVSWSTTVPDYGPLSYDFMNNWLGQTLFTYLLVEENTDLGKLEKQMPAFMKRHFPERADSYFLHFQPLKDIYLGSEDILYGRNLVLGNPTYTYTFMLAALFVLLIACVNYINIQTARASRRAGEIGIRKVLGARRGQLMVQFFGEALLFVIISTFLSLFLVDLMLPYFNNLSGARVSGSLIWHPQILAGIGVIIIFTSLLAGIYPAQVLSELVPAVSLKSSSVHAGGLFSRKVLITFQYAISITLIIASLVVLIQTRFMQNKPLGFDQEHIVVMNINNSLESSHREFSEALKRHPDIEAVSAGQATVGTGWFGTTIIPVGRENELSVSAFRIGAEYIHTMGIEILAGRCFVGGSPSDSSSVIINEALAHLLGVDDPLSMSIRFSPDDIPRPVIGVVKDFNYEGLNESTVRPAVMYLYPRNFYNLTVRISGDDVAGTLGYMEKLWNIYSDRFPFEYYFASDWFDQKYTREVRLLSTVTVFSIVSIILSFLGLYGLTTYTIQQRMKEFSIRKVLGASQILLTFSVNKALAILVLIGFFIAAPVAWYIMKLWLQDFAYQAVISPWIYLIAGISVLLMTILAVSFQAWKATRVNPADVLRSE